MPQGRSPDARQIVKVSDVLIGEMAALKKALAERLDTPEVAERVFRWLRPRLPTTLVLDKEATSRAKDKAVAACRTVLDFDRATSGAGRPAAVGRQHRLAADSSTQPT